jgi:BON domain-containing protein
MPDRHRDPRRGDSRDYWDYESDEIQPFGTSRDLPRDRADWASGYPGERARRGRYYGVGPKGYRRSDERILEEVSDRLMTHPDVDASDIEVRVEHGVITLAGTVPDRHQKRIAEFIADDIVGVDDVHNELSVRHGFWSSLVGGNDADDAVREREQKTSRVSDIAARENAARAAAERDRGAR